MKKVECPSCGATGVLLQWQGMWTPGNPHLCDKCKGFGFILIDPAEFAKFKKVRNTRYDCTGGIRISSGPVGSWWNIKNSPPEYTEFTCLCKVRNLREAHICIPGRDHEVPYNVFYKEHRNPRG